MRQRAHHSRTAAVVLAVLAVGLPLSVGLLDAREPPSEPRVESRHDPGRCSWAHDHAACVQLAHSFAAPAAPGGAVTSRGRATRTAPRPAPDRPTAPPSTTRHSRAPPIHGR